MESVLEYVTEGNRAQMRDPAFVAELKHWIRFNESQAVSTGDGLFTRSSGNPTSPSWLGARLFNLFFSEKSENDKYAKQMRSSAGVAVLAGERSEAANWFGVGRAYQRLALVMTTLGVRNAFVNQVIEVPAVRRQFVQWLSVPAQHPDLGVGLGHRALLPDSLRRPVTR
jgi:hypothetical protein